MTILINSGYHLSCMSVMKVWDSRRPTIRPSFTHRIAWLPVGHTKEIHYSRRRLWVALHLRLNSHPEGSQIRTPGGGLPGGEDLPQISGSPADPGCFPYWPKGWAWHRFLCSPLRQSSIGMWQICHANIFLITFIFIFNKKDLICEINTFKGQKKVSERKTKGL